MGLKIKLEEWFEPELCETGSQNDLDRKDYVAELKVDGTRVIIEKIGEDFRIYSRRGLAYNETLPEVVEPLRTMKHDYRLDGEVVYIDKNGHMVFAGSQFRCQISAKEKIDKYKDIYPVGLYVWDIMMLDGVDLTKVPYWKRRKILENFVNLQNQLYGFTNIRIIPQTTENRKMYEWAKENGFEGVVLKQINSVYEPDTRSICWLKVKCREHTSFVMEIAKE
jgi:ATP-dependent DNA ligase